MATHCHRRIYTIKMEVEGIWSYTRDLASLLRADIILAKSYECWRPAATISGYKRQLYGYHLINPAITQECDSCEVPDTSLRLNPVPFYCKDKYLVVMQPASLGFGTWLLIQKMEKEICIQTRFTKKKMILLKHIGKIKQPTQKKFNNDILIRDDRSR